MNSHIGDFDTFLNYINLDEKIKNPNIINFKFNSIPNVLQEKGSNISTKSKTRANKLKKTVSETINYSEQNNVLMAFQNNEKFIKLIKLIGRPVKPSIYIYTEDSYVVVLINSAEYYPIVIAKFPIQEPSIYVKPGFHSCFQFPYQPLLNFISQQDRTNLNFTILLVNNDNRIEIELHNYNHTNISKIPNYETENKERILHNVFTYKITGPKYSEFDKTVIEDIDYMNKFSTMKIMFLKEMKTNGNFTKHLKDKTSHTIYISDNKIIMEIITNKIVSKLILANRKTSKSKIKETNLDNEHSSDEENETQSFKQNIEFSDDDNFNSDLINKSIDATSARNIDDLNDSDEAEIFNTKKESSESKKSKSVGATSTMKNEQNSKSENLFSSIKNSNILYWNDEFKNKTLRLVKYTNIFKHVNKLSNGTDMVYYGICKWDILPNTYVFIKIITNKNVKNYFDKRNEWNGEYDGDDILSTQTPTFENIFENNDYICEFILCLED